MIERHCRREESVEEALIDMYLAGVSTRQVDDTGQLLWGDRMPSRTLSDKLKRVYAEIDEWRTRPLGVVPEFLRTLVFARPRGDDQFADCTFSPSLDMSR